MSNEIRRKYRSEYQPAAYLVSDIWLDFDIQADHTRVTARHKVRRNPAAEQAWSDWWLDGRDMQLVSLKVNGDNAEDKINEHTSQGLWLTDLPAQFELEIVTIIDPDHNLSMEGFYRSGSILCTQCEATGFSRMTYFPDRPDIMSRYATRIEADAEQFPVLLSNGNRIEAGQAGPGRHYAVFADPFAKPCYLFAVVAGDLSVVRDQYTTLSGHDVALSLYTEHGNESQCYHAMASLKQAMAWDEAVYGLEYDLDVFNIVAVGSFNMGAMENKSLNIFNTACIFAHQDTATDADFARVRDVVAHEYFHNYTGNRVTCRDWFQLSLKEGLTVFREHQFAMDHGSPGATRIEQVRLMRDIQFPEDAGPRAHPVCPESYVQMDNFYTITIYEKGAELIHMLAEILGREHFIQAARHYLSKHDGQAVTIEDFILAMEEASELNLSQFRHWYSYAGTPELQVRPQYADGQLDLVLSQHTPATPGQDDKPDFDIPVSVALFDQAGRVMKAPRTLRLSQKQESFRFSDLNEQPVPSVLRGMSAPVRVDYPRSQDELSLLMAHDTDPVSSWDAAQSLYLELLRQTVTAWQQDQSLPGLNQGIRRAVHSLLTTPPTDRALLAEMLMLPSAMQIGQVFEAMDVAALESARDHVKLAIAREFESSLWQLLEDHTTQRSYVFNQQEAGRRRVVAVALDYLASLDTPEVRKYALALYKAADNMTDRMAALQALQQLPGDNRQAAWQDFAQRFAHYPLVMDKWLRLQVTTRDGDSVARARELLADSRFDFTNPNRIRALIGGLVRGNPLAFHRQDGTGYELVADEVLRLDQFNPQMAAAIAGLLAPWRRYTQPYADGMKKALERINQSELSANTREIIDTSLAA